MARSELVHHKIPPQCRPQLGDLLTWAGTCICLGLQGLDRSRIDITIRTGQEYVEICIYTLSVGKVAGLESPALFDLFVVSINSGTKRLLGLGVSSGGGLCGEGSGEGRDCPALSSLLLLKLISTGTGTRRRFPALSFLSTAVPPLSRLLLRVVVSTGSGANRRTFLTVSSTGTGWKRLAGGGVEMSGILAGGIYFTGSLSRPYLRQQRWHSRKSEELPDRRACACDQIPVCSVVRALLGGCS